MAIIFHKIESNGVTFGVKENGWFMFEETLVYNDSVFTQRRISDSCWFIILKEPN